MNFNIVALLVICWLPNYLAIRFILSSIQGFWKKGDRACGILIAFPLGPLGLFLVAGALIYLLIKRICNWWGKPSRW